MLPGVGNAPMLIDKAAAVGLNVRVAALLPPVVMPPLASLTAPVLTVTVTEAVEVGVPVTGQEMLWPAASEATGVVGVQVPSVRPAGSAETAHVAFVAAAFDPAAFVHRTVPVYGTPTEAVAVRPLRSGLMSEPVTVTAAVAMLFARLSSLVAPVEPLIVMAPTTVGVPETAHVIVAPGASDAAGEAGVQTVVRPAGIPVAAHVALIAAIDGAVALVQV
jgi:hypothetical protein